MPAEPIGEAAARGDLGDLAAQAAQLGAGLARVVAGARRDLEHGLVELGLDVAGVVGAASSSSPSIALASSQVSGVEDHQLLLDAQGVAGAGEVRLHGAGG